MLKKITALSIVLCIILPFAFAQQMDLSGVWTGGLSQNDKVWVFEMTLQLKQVNNSITGTARYKARDGGGAYVLYNISGSIQDGLITLNDLDIIEENNLNGSWNWCKKIYSGNAVIHNDSIFFSGDWKNEGKKIYYNGHLSENTGITCYPGSFYVRKAYHKPTPVSPVPPSKPVVAPPPSTPGNTFRNRQVNIKDTVYVQSDSVKLSFYDNAEIDNDTITVYYNNRLLLHTRRLSDKPVEVYINVSNNADNQILMYADNEGSIPPNTALLIFYDMGKRREIRIDSNTKKSGAIVFRKKQ